ncbi:MAG: hypothetical protein ISR96_08230 [Nitrospira sp.]|nr:hypothetical protein [bacterium]MBL7049485.1 hypothetical protein [Nitrospira sp.]
MKILHIINDKQDDLSRKVIEFQSDDSELRVIELASKAVSYDELVDEIFASDKVISW